MKTYDTHINENICICSATDDLYYAMHSLGFNCMRPDVRRGCHWGQVWLFHEDLELARNMIDPKDKAFKIVTPGHQFNFTASVGEDVELDNLWTFSIRTNK